MKLGQVTNAFHLFLFKTFFDENVKFLTGAVSLDLSKFHFALNELKEANQYCEKAVKSQTRPNDALFHKTVLLYEQGKQEEAKQIFESIPMDFKVAQIKSIFFFLKVVPENTSLKREVSVALKLGEIKYQFLFIFQF